MPEILEALKQPLLSVILGGLTGALVAHILNSRWQNQMLKRQKLEDMYNSMKLYARGTDQMYEPFVDYFKLKSNLTESYSLSKKGQEDAAEGESKTHALVHIYFPELLNRINELHEAKFYCDTMISVLLNNNQLYYIEPVHYKDQFIGHFAKVSVRQIQILNEIIKKADKRFL